MQCPAVQVSTLIRIMKCISTLKQTKILCALRMPRASSRNVGKFYLTVKLSAKNLCLFHADSN